MSHNTLANYYQTIFNMMTYHGFSHSEVEGFIPFERDLYQDMILNKIEQAAKKQQGVEYAFG